MIDSLDVDQASKDRWKVIIDAEVNGQVNYYLANNEFPSDQIACTLDYIHVNYPHIAI